MRKALLILTALAGLLIPVQAQVRSLKVEKPLKSGPSWIIEIHNVGLVPAETFSVSFPCGDERSLVGDTYDGLGPTSLSGRIPPEGSVGILQQGGCGKTGSTEITGAVFADGHTEGDVRRIEAIWAGYRDGLKDFIPLIAGVVASKVNGARLLSEINGQLPPERQTAFTDTEATGYCGFLVALRNWWTRGTSATIGSGERVTLPKPGLDSDSARAATLLRLLLDWQARLNGRHQVISETKSVLLPASGLVDRPAAKVPSLKESPPFQTGFGAGTWIEPVQNVGSVPVEAIYTSFDCQRGGFVVHNTGDPYDGLVRYMSNASPLPPSQSMAIASADPTSCIGGVTGAIFADGHIEGDPAAIDILMKRRQGAYQALGDFIPRVHTLVDGKATDSAFLEEIKSRTSAILAARELRTPETDGYREVLNELRFIWDANRSCCTIDLETPFGKTVKIPPANRKSLQDGSDTKRDSQVASLLQEWRSALEGNITMPAPKN